MNKVTIDRALIEQALETLEIGDNFRPGLARVALRAALAEPAVEPYDHGPQAATTAEALRDVSKWLNERPNRPLDLRHVAMLCAALAEPVVQPFGYFRAEPFGWTDCAPTDEGAKALYEAPPPAEPAPVPLWDIEDLAHTALQEALSYGLGLDLFVRYFKVAQKASPPPPAEPAPVPLLSDAEILQLTPLWFKKYTDGVLLGHARAIEQLVRRKAGL